MAWDFVLSLLRVQVQSLVRELRPCKLHGVTKKKKHSHLETYLLEERAAQRAAAAGCGILESDGPGCEAHSSPSGSLCDGGNCA